MHYVVAFAKLEMDKGQGVRLDGICFGGIGGTQAEAETIARDCVNDNKHSTVLPRVFPMERQSLLDVLDDATARFEKIVENMREAEAVISKRKQLV